MSTTKQSAPESRTDDRVARERNNRSLVKRAISGDVGALSEMVQSFVPADERVISCAHVGTFGFLFRLRAFFAVTDRRAVSIIVHPFRGFVYTDGLLEHVNSSGIGQPTRGRLYFAWFVIWLWMLAIGGAGAVAAADATDGLVPVVLIMASLTAMFLSAMFTRWWFRRNKTGIFLNVREGLAVISFVDARHLPRAMVLYRDFSLARDGRLAALALSAA